jgi:hypothetical protein
MGFISSVFILIVTSRSQRLLLRYGASTNLLAVYWVSAICNVFASSAKAWPSTHGVSERWRFLGNCIFIASALLAAR